MNNIDDTESRLDAISQKAAAKIQKPRPASSPHKPGAAERARQSEENRKQVQKDAATAPLAYDCQTGEVINGTSNYKPPQNDIDESKPLLPILSMGGSVPFNDVQFLWEGLFSYQLGLIGGRQGLGKSTFACYLAAMISHPGVNIWTDNTPCPTGCVLFFIPEGGQGFTDNRIKTIGGKLENIGYYKGLGTGRRRPDGTIDVDADPTVEDIQALNGAIDALEKSKGLPCKLVIIDPITDFMGNIKQNDSAEVSRILRPLDYLAAERNLCILMIKHLNKHRNETSALYDVGGSNAFTSKPRWVYILDESPTAREAALAGETDYTKEAILAYAKVNDFQIKKSIHFSIAENGKMDFPTFGTYTAESLGQELRSINAQYKMTEKQADRFDRKQTAKTMLEAGSSVKEVAKAVERSESTIYSWIDKGQWQTKEW